MDSLVCANGFELNQSIKNSIVTFYKGAFVATVSFIFSLFNQRYNLYSEIMWKNVHPVDCGGIHTHNFKNMSLLDQGSSEVCCTTGKSNQFCWTLDWQNSHFALRRLQKSGYNILCILIIVISVLAFYSAEIFQFYWVKLLENNKNRKKMSQGMMALRLACFINLNFFC